VRPTVPAAFNTVSPGIHAEVLDDDGRPLRDQVGELAVLSPFVGMTKSFWEDRARYIETYWSRFPDIWVHGDLALRTSDGSYFILGRSDDTMKIAGKRLGPAEVEEILLELGDVSEAAAIGIDDPVKGQKLIVFIVRPANADRTEAAMVADVGRLIEHRLGKAFRPARVHSVAELPKTRSLKIMRRVIRQVYCGLPPGDLSSLDNPTALEVIRAAATA